MTGAGGEVRLRVCISWLELQGSTDRDGPTDRASFGRAMAYFRTNSRSFALEFLPTFWRAGEANVGGDKV